VHCTVPAPASRVQQQQCFLGAGVLMTRRRRCGTGSLGLLVRHLDIVHQVHLQTCSRRVRQGRHGELVRGRTGGRRQHLARGRGCSPRWRRQHLVLVHSRDTRGRRRQHLVRRHLVVRRRRLVRCPVPAPNQRRGSAPAVRVHQPQRFVGAGVRVRVARRSLLVLHDVRHSHHEGHRERQRGHVEVLVLGRAGGRRCVSVMETAEKRVDD
jgi:hypothetical protein